MQRSFALINPVPSTSNQYSFKDQEQDYSLFRPQWPRSFAVAALKKADINYVAEIGEWVGLHQGAVPIIVIIGSGAGADAKPFLDLGCIVYAIEPNAELRRLAREKFSSKRTFISIDGDAHKLNLPLGLVADLIICAQALHTFSSEITGLSSSEGLARQSWQSVLPNDQKDRVSIWYYNIDASLPLVVDLDKRLKLASKTYAKSKTPFLDAPMFEPEKFQHYIEAKKMNISSAQCVDKARLDQTTLMRWLRSFSFYPKDFHEEAVVKAALIDWFVAHNNQSDTIELPFIGFIAQGPLRLRPYFQTSKNDNLLQASPLTLAMRANTNESLEEFWPERPILCRFSFGM